MDENPISSTIDKLQKRIDELEGLIEAAEAREEEEEIGYNPNRESSRLEQEFAFELGTSYREILKLLLQAGRDDETFRPIHMSTTWFERIDAYDELAENTMLLARMQEMEGHDEWAEPTLELAVWYAQEKKQYYKDILRAFLKRKKKERGNENEIDDEDEMEYEDEMDEVDMRDSNV